MGAGKTFYRRNAVIGQVMGNNGPVPQVVKNRWAAAACVLTLVVFVLGAYNLNLITENYLLQSHYVFVEYKETTSLKQTEVPYFSHDRDKQDGTWKSFLRPYELYAYSAFYDDRKSLGTLPVVRIIAVSENLDERELYCKVMYLGTGHITVVKALHMEIGVGVSRHGKRLLEYVLTCPLEDEDIPYEISLLPMKESNLTFIMPIHVPYRPSHKKNFMLCVSVTYWKPDSHRIIEWMELMRILGVSKVTIYNNSLSDEAARVFQHYDLTGFVDFRQSHNFISDAGELTIHLHMSPVINDCMYRNMHAYKKIVVTDLDEVIIPRVHYSYAEMLLEMDKTYPSSHPARNYVFFNAYFFTDITPKTANSTSNLTTLKYLQRLPPSPVGYSMKSIIDPQACARMHNHYCWGLTKLYDREGDHIDVPPEIALNQHYKKCHLDVYDHPGKCNETFTTAVQDNSMLRFADDLTKLYDKKLDELNL